MKVSVQDRRTRQHRRPKSVTEHIILRNDLGESLYYLCPCCNIFLPREYMRFCDVCGQRLGWELVHRECAE